MRKGRDVVITLKDLQAAIKSVDYQPGQELRYLAKLMEEVGEVARALRQPLIWSGPDMSIKGTLDEELVDVLYYVAALANLYGIDLEKATAAKDALNAVRYRRDPLFTEAND